MHKSLDDSGRPKVLVGRLRWPYRRLIPSALRKADNLLGAAYDEEFIADNNSYYCSELIYEIFLADDGGGGLFELKPMTFKNPLSGEIIESWQRYFAQLGKPVPEGLAGINPGDISRSPVLRIVHAYGRPSGYEGKKKD